MQYGALRDLSYENTANEWRNQNSTNRIWPLSTLLVLIMTTAFLFLMWEGNKAHVISDVQSFTEIGLNESKQSSADFNFSIRKPSASSLVADGDGGNDARLADVLSLSTLLKGSMAVQCSDSVSWGR
jgi:hypothetical protein